MPILATPPAPHATAGLPPAGSTAVEAILAGAGPAAVPATTIDDVTAALSDPALPIESWYAFEEAHDQVSISVQPLGFSLYFEIGRVVMHCGRDYDFEDIDASFTSDLEETGLLPGYFDEREHAKVLLVESLLESQRERVQALIDEKFGEWEANRQRIRELFGSIPSGSRIPLALEEVEEFHHAERLHAVAMRYHALMSSVALPDLSDVEWKLLDAAVPDLVLDMADAQRIDAALAGACAEADAPEGPSLLAKLAALDLLGRVALVERLEARRDARRREAR